MVGMVRLPCAGDVAAGGGCVEEVPEDLARWAVGAGLAVIQELTTALSAGADPLQLGTRLRDRLDADRAAFATAAAATRLRAVEQGVEGADQLVLTREALEQASHPAAAAWRARRAWGAVGRTEDTDGVDGAADAAPVQDRCAGTGGDAVALAAHGPVLAVERDAGRAVLAEHRAAVLGRPVTVRVADALDPTLRCRGTVVHADPDRRDPTGRRARTLSQHRPSVSQLLQATNAAAGRLLTIAPGVSWDDPELPHDAEVVFLQHGADLLEAVLCTGAARSARATPARATAVLLDRGEQRTRTGDDREELPVGPVGAVLLVPAPALVRARLHDALGGELGARRIARRRALLTSDEIPSSPWVTAERVEAVLPARPAAVRDHLRGRSDRRVELVLHGIQVDVRAWLRDAGRPATGPDDLRIHLVRRDEDAVAVLTTLCA